MSHPTIYPAKIFFYPIGNTPPVCFTNSQPPEGPVDILLLACGDPRSVLYTSYADIGASRNRQLDITCCDTDPAIIARNVLLYTLVTDDISPDRSKIIWNIFYHHYIDKSSMELLVKHCRKLLGISTDLDTWHSSPYGTIFRFCTSHSLLEVRRHWELYTTCDRLSSYLKNDFVEGMQSNLRRYRDGLSVVTRAGGPLWQDLMGLGRESIQKYWSTGVTTCKSNNQLGANLVNPTFAYSLKAEETFNTHYGTDPIMSFHLSARLAPTTLNEVPVMKVEDLVEFAQSQFHVLCTAFNSRVRNATSANIRIRFFVGDALALCKAFRCCAVGNMLNAGVYSNSWGSSIIDFCPSDYRLESNGLRNAPVTFDVIDTSNISDHLGIFNVVTATMPLLRNKSTSILHTDTLHPPPDNTKSGASSDLMDRLCIDMKALSVLFGISPVSYLSNFTTHSNTHELVLTTVQHHDQVAWKKSYLGDSSINPDTSTCHLKFNPTELGTLLYNVYLELFDNENHSSFFANFSIRGLQRRAISHYDRTSFAEFLKAVKDRTETNWREVMEHLLELILNNRTHMIGSNYYQDLSTQLHLRGVHTEEGLTTQFSRNLATQTSHNPLRGWKNLPSVVCVVFEVPRYRLQVLENGDTGTVGTPVLICDIRAGFAHNIFTSIRLIFGKMKIYNPESSESRVSIIEDPKGWTGDSPLVVSFYVPFPTLTYESAANTQVSLSLASTPSMSQLVPVLGMSLNLFSTSLADKQHIRIVRTRPDNDKELDGLLCTSLVRDISPVGTSNSAAVSTAGQVSVKLNNTCETPSLFTSHIDIVDANEKKALSNKAAVSAKQNSPCSMLVSFANFEKIVSFPFPIDGTNSKLRIARKSFYVEVDVLLSGPLLPNGYSITPFPLLRALERRVSPSLWNIHYVNLDLLPSLDVKSKKRMAWLSPHLNLSLSDRERNSSREFHELAELTPWVNLKQSVATILLESAGIGKFPKPVSVFSLSDPAHGGGYTLIFVNSLRLDVASHTAVVDACVLPLTNAIMPTVRPVLQSLLNRGAICTVITLESEVRLWKHLLPALTERCRRWEHNENCAYISKGVPVSVVSNQNPLCTCGQGKALGSFMQSEWKTLAPHVTRIALSPFFAVPYLESIVEDLLSSITEKMATKLAFQETCQWCEGEGKPKLLICSRCKDANYCSATCQKADWQNHKLVCRKVA